MSETKNATQNGASTQNGAAILTPTEIAVMQQKIAMPVVKAPRSEVGSLAGSTRMSRTYRSSSRRSAGGSKASFMSAHKQKMSAELTAQAEAKFLSLMDVLASASREASSLKESWSRIISEREAFNAEREELLEQITEVQEELEQNTAQNTQSGDDLVEKTKQVETLLSQLSVATASASTEKKLVLAKDTELQRTHDELRLIKELSSRTKTDYERVRSEIETITATLATATADRDGAKEEAVRIKKELHKVVRERLEISSRLTELTTELDSSRKELLTITDRLKVVELEKEENVTTIERLQEESRKLKIRVEETTKDLTEVTEKYERSQRELTKLRESLRVVETERDELTHAVEHKNREIKTLVSARDELQHTVVELTAKYDNVRRELLSVRESLRNAELARNEQTEIAQRATEQLRLLVIERDEIKDEVVDLRRKVDEGHRQLTILQASLRKSEQTITDLRSEAFTHIEQKKLIERERDDWRGKHGGVVTELTQLRDSFVAIQAELRIVTDDRTKVRGELEKKIEEYEEITETVTTTNNESAELEFEIESLRTMLREAREQKERAITARNTADKERDEFIVKYEEKCREMERFEEQAASYYHAHSSSKSSGESTTTTTRKVKSSGAASSSSNGAVAKSNE